MELDGAKRLHFDAPKSSFGKRNSLIIRNLQRNGDGCRKLRWRGFGHGDGQSKTHAEHHGRGFVLRRRDGQFGNGDGRELLVERAERLFERCSKSNDFERASRVGRAVFFDRDRWKRLLGDDDGDRFDKYHLDVGDSEQPRLQRLDVEFSLRRGRVVELDGARQLHFDGSKSLDFQRNSRKIRRLQRDDDRWKRLHGDGFGRG